ncbi:MAG: ABC transporter ATP-binding protein [Patescibacteria group bacterium]
MKTETINTKAVFAVFWQHMRKYRVSFFATIVLILVGSAIDILAPLYYKQFFDLLTGVTTQTNAQLVAPLTHALVLVLAFHLFGWACWRTTGFIESWRNPRVMTDLDQTAHAALHVHSYKFFSDNFAGSLVRKANRIERAFDNLTEQVLWKFLPLSVIITGSTIVLFLRNPLLAIILIVWMIIFFGINIWYSVWKLPYEVTRTELDSEATGVLADSITNAITTKLFTGVEHEKSLYKEVTERVRKMNTFIWNLNGVMEAVQSLLMIAIEFIMMYVAIGLWQKGILTIGDFALIQVYLIGMFAKLWDIGHAIRRAYEAIADAAQMIEIMETVPDIVDVHGAKLLNPHQARIEFQKVYFSFHKTRRILKDMNLVIEPGQRVALVGPSGAGKSTITKLLLRFYDVERGRILIGNQNIARVTQDSLRAHIATVPQEPILFHRSILDNIRYGRRDATDEEVFEAAKKARCHEFIMELPDTYGTFVGERGVKLSGGERQRIAIARAILKDAPILVLDEATSSLDSESESLIQEALHELMVGKTTIVIAHRLSTIMEMDRIIVLEDGQVVDDGTHEELLARKSGIYKNLWQIQAGGFIQ